MWGLMLLLSQCQHIAGPMAILVCASSQWKKKNLFLWCSAKCLFQKQVLQRSGNLRYARCSLPAKTGFANCILRKENFPLWVCFVCAAVIYVMHIVNLIIRQWNLFSDAHECCKAQVSSTVFHIQKTVKLIKMLWKWSKSSCSSLFPAA